MIKKSLCNRWLQYNSQVHRHFVITLYFTEWRKSLYKPTFSIHCPVWQEVDTSNLQTRLFEYVAVSWKLVYTTSYFFYGRTLNYRLIFIDLIPLCSMKYLNIRYRLCCTKYTTMLVLYKNKLLLITSRKNLKITYSGRNI
jgi:hypothetical protein